jgi:hypothetical protein
MSAATAIAVAGVATAAYSTYKASKAASANDANAKQAASMQQQAQTQQSDLSKSMVGYANQQFKLAGPALSAGMGYYSKILGGDRAAVQGAIAPDVAGVNTAYEGTQKYLDQQGVRGGARDNAVAENERQRVGQVGMLPFMARQGAAANLTQSGLALNSQGNQALSAASGATSAAGGQAYNFGNQQFGQGQVRGGQIADMGGNVAKLFAQWMQGRGGGQTPAGSPAPTNTSAFGGEF